MIIGMAITAPVGPIGILCVNRTLSRGRVSGLVSGLGAVTADGFYCAIAAFSLTLISNVLTGHQVWFRLAGGSFLLFLGARIFFLDPQDEVNLATKGNLLSDYLSALVVSITNPLTIIAFAAIFAALGLGTMKKDLLSASMMTLGVVAGSAGGWALLSFVTNGIRLQFNTGILRIINRISGVLIFSFAVAAFLSVMIR